MRLSNVFGWIAASLTVSGGTKATLLDPVSFTETVLATTASNATSMAWTPDGSGRLFVTQKEGRVSIVKNGALLATPFASESATSGGGSAATLNIGGAVTGGDFWSSSALPTAYRGNYFFGDYNSGVVERVTLALDNSVSSVDHFATGSARPRD